MDIVELIKREHGKTINLFEKLSDTSNGAVKTRERLFGQLKTGLEVHAKVVQDLVYPLLRRQEEMRELIPELKERNELRKMLGDLDEMAKEDEAFLPRLKELRKLVDQHLRSEQRQIFPAIKKAIGGEEAEELAKRIVAETREELQEATQAENGAEPSEGENTERSRETVQELTRSMARGAERFIGESAESAQQTATTTGREAQRMTELAGQQMQATAEGFQVARRAYAEMNGEAAERLRTLSVVPTAAMSALTEVQSAWSELVTKSIERNARAAQDFFRCKSPQEAASVQRRLLDETINGFFESNVRILRATRRAADNALQPLEAEMGREREGSSDRDAAGRNRRRQQAA